MTSIGRLFEKSELGRIKKLLPLREMAEHFGLVSKSMNPKLGRKSYFTPEGKVALMFLKMYTGLNCPKRKSVHIKVLPQGNYASAVGNRRKIRPK